MGSQDPALIVSDEPSPNKVQRTKGPLGLPNEHPGALAPKKATKAYAALLQLSAPELEHHSLQLAPV